MPCPLARCYAALFPLLSSLVFFHPVSRLEREGGQLLECKHPTKQGIDSIRDALFPSLDRKACGLHSASH